MKRYIVSKEAIKILKVETYDAVTLMGSDAVIINEAIEYKELPFVSLPLQDDEVALLKKNNIQVKEEVLATQAALSVNMYEHAASGYFDLKRRLPNENLGAGIKVAILDSGSNLPYEFGINLVDNNTNVTDVFNHGTGNHGIIKSAQMGMANGAIVHIVKIIQDNNSMTESSYLAGLDYCLQQNIDVVNCSFVFYSTNAQVAINLLRTNNCVVIAAAGNSRTDAYCFEPSALNHVFAVNTIDNKRQVVRKNYQALDSQGQLIVDAQGNPISLIDFCASGEFTLRVNASLNIGLASGTSLSAPFITAAAAIYAAKLRLIDSIRFADNYEVMKVLKSNCTPQTPAIYFGAGSPNFDNI